jgi:hypothetical protein
MNLACEKFRDTDLNIFFDEPHKILILKALC